MSVKNFLPSYTHHQRRAPMTSHDPDHKKSVDKYPTIAPTDCSDDGLDDNLRDKMVAIAKGAAGALPIAGGIVSEIVGAVIPGQRADRITVYLRALSQRVGEMEESTKKNLADNAEKIDLIEEGGFQSARATSQERIAYIIEAVSRGLSAEDSDVLRRKRLLLILSSLDDDEVNLLNAYGRAYGTGDRHAFDGVNLPDPPHLQSERGAIERRQLYEVGKNNLIQFGLLKKNYGTVKKGTLPEFDTRQGDFKHRLEISYLGRMLLREIGMTVPIDAQHDARNDSATKG